MKNKLHATYPTIPFNPRKQERHKGILWCKLNYVFNNSFPQVFCCFVTQVSSKQVLLILKLLLVCFPKICPLDHLHGDQLFQQQPLAQCISYSSDLKDNIYIVFELREGRYATLSQGDIPKVGNFRQILILQGGIQQA